MWQDPFHFLGNHAGFRHPLFEVGVTPDMGQLVQCTTDFRDIRFHPGIGAAEPGAVGIGVAAIAEFVPALRSTIGNMQPQEVVLADSFIMVKIRR
ncbi:Uncharacterised protein [Serratia ficaria]|nr:Uncharacterised protein [Serratia ficaria]